MALSERRVDSVLSCELGSDRLEFETSLGSAPSARVGAVGSGGSSRVRVEQRWIRVEKTDSDPNGSVSDRWPSAKMQKLLAIVGEDGGCWRRRRRRIVVGSSTRFEVGNGGEAIVVWRRCC